MAVGEALDTIEARIRLRLDASRDHPVYVALSDQLERLRHRQLTQASASVEFLGDSRASPTDHRCRARNTGCPRHENSSIARTRTSGKTTDDRQPAAVTGVRASGLVGSEEGTARRPEGTQATRPEPKVRMRRHQGGPGPRPCRWARCGPRLADAARSAPS